MSTFAEHEHPRAQDGRFSVKAAGEATGVTLACDPVAVDETPETFEMLWCEACALGFDEAEAAPLYECGNCNAKSTERRCEQCHKFMSRSEEPGCPQCGEPVDENTVEMVHDHDGQVIRAEDYEPDGPAKAERDEQAKIAAAEQAEADRIARLAAKKNNTALGTAAAIEPGAVLINPDDDSKFATEAEVLSVRPVETPDGPIVIFKTYEYSHRTVVRRASDPVPTKAVVDKHPTQGRDGTRLTAADFGGARLVDGFNPEMHHVSSPSGAIDVVIGPSSRDGGTLPTLALMVGRRSRSGDLAGMVSYIGRWDDPTEAEAALDEMDRAADALAAARAEHPPTPENAEDEARHRADMGPNWSAVKVEEADWVTADVQPTLRMEVGLADWEPDKGALLTMQAGGGMNVALDDPAALKTAVAEARKHLHRLTGIPERPDVVDDKI